MEMYQQHKYSDDEDKQSGSDKSDSDDESNQKGTDRNNAGGDGAASNVDILLFRNRLDKNFSWRLLRLKRRMRY